MVNQRSLPDFRLVNGDGRERPFHEFLADFNILAIRRVPAPSHGPATELLRRLLAENRGVEDETVRGFDIRSPDRSCETCHDGPHIVFQGPDLVTICDGGRGIYQRFGVVGDDRFFVVRSDRCVVDVGSIREIGRLRERLSRDMAPTPHHVARAPPATRSTDPRPAGLNGRTRSCRARLSE